MKKFVRIVLVGVSVAILAGFASCGAGGVRGGSQGVTESVIRVGNTAPTSGAFAMVGVPFNNGIRAYFQQVNQAGGVHGRMIEFINHDDGFDPVNGLAFTETLIHDDRVFAIVGHFGTPTVGATLGMLREVGIPTVYFATGIGSLFSDDAFDNARGRNLFPVQAIYVTEGRVLVARAIEEYNARNIGVIFTSDEAGHDFVRGINYQLNMMDGDFRLVTEQVSPGQPDVSSAVLRMMNENVDVVIAGALQQTFITIINSLVINGMNVPVFTTYINADPVVIMGFATDYLGIGASFPIYSTQWVDIGLAEDNFTQAYWDYVYGITAFGYPELAMNTFAMTGWIAGSTFVAGLRNTDPDNITWTSFIEAMENTLIDLPMAGVMDFSNGQRIGTTHLALARANVAQAVWEVVRPIEYLGAILERMGLAGNP